jgi:hypothetical protein
MTLLERQEKNKIINSSNELKNTFSAKKLRNEFMAVILSYSKNLPNWGGLKVNVS